MNSLESFLSDEFVRAFAWTLFHSLWQGGLLALFAAAVLTLLRKHRPTVRYALLCLLMAMMPVLFMTTFFFIYDPSPDSNLQNLQALFSSSKVANPDIGRESIELLSTGHWYDNLARLFENQAIWLVTLWFAGFTVFLVRFTGSLVVVYRLKTSRIYSADLLWSGRIRDLSSKIGLKKPVRLAESALARIPMTIGYLKPVILLPLGTLSGVPPQQIEAILLHELAHILRKDYLINILQSFIELLFFYHPVTWWLSGLIRQEREHICDDLVISINHDHINYIKALTTMEELNLKSPVLANAMNGNRKKLLNRINRLISPVRLRKGIGEGIIAFITLVGLVFALSLNALSVIPSAYDLTGRESGEKIYNLLPYNPDTVITKSGSKKIVVKVITDSINNETEKEIEVFIDEPDLYTYKYDFNNDFNKDFNTDNKDDRVIILKKSNNENDSLSKIIVIKSGDSLRVITGDTTLVLPEGYDTTFTTDGGMYFYGYDIPEISGFPEPGDFPEIPELEYFYFDEGRAQHERQYERALRDYEIEIRDLERQQRDLKDLQKEFEWQSAEPRVYVNPPDSPDNFIWVPGEQLPPVRNSEKIIRQELRDDGLTERGRKYVIEIDSRSMYINGEKQPKEVYKKYRKLVESTENVTFSADETFKLIF